MKNSALLSIPLICCGLVTLAVPQGGAPPKMPSPPPSLDHPISDRTTPDQAPVHLSRRIDLAQLQRDADDLARTAQTIPSDVASIRQGMLPKDVIQKLKEIEKLSKHLRGELNP